MTRSSQPDNHAESAQPVIDRTRPEPGSTTHGSRHRRTSGSTSHSRPVLWLRQTLRFVSVGVLLLAASATAAQNPADPPATVRETLWYIVTWNGDPVGYEYISTTGLPDGSGKPPADAPPLRRFRRTEMKLRRFGRDLSVSSEVTTQELAEGTLLEWTLKREAGDGGVTERTGHWDSDLGRCLVSEKSQATRRSLQVASRVQPSSPLISAWAGHVMRTEPRRFSRLVLFPETNTVAELQFDQLGPQSLQLAGGETINVYPLRFQPDADPQLATTLYIDEAGIVRRSEQWLLGQMLALELTDAATALAAAGVRGLDIDAQSLIPVDRQIGRPTTRDITRLKLVCSRGTPAIPDTQWQSAEPQPDGSVIVTLRRPVPAAQSDTLVPATHPRADPVYRRRTHLLNWDTDAVRLVSLRAGGSDTDFTRCETATRYLTSNLKHSPFSTSLVSAEDVARSMRGDCTEHAILLAALFRAREVPSRVVTGLVYVERVSAFAAHMWVEAWIDGAWVPFDSAVGKSRFGADHIKLADSALLDEDSDGITLFLPLLALLGGSRMELLPDSE